MQPHTRRLDIAEIIQISETAYATLLQEFTYRLGQASGESRGRLAAGGNPGVVGNLGLELTEFTERFEITVHGMGEPGYRWVKAEIESVSLGILQCQIHGDADTLKRLREWISTTGFVRGMNPNLLSDGTLLAFWIDHRDNPYIRAVERKYTGGIPIDLPPLEMRPLTLNYEGTADEDTQP